MTINKILRNLRLSKNISVKDLSEALRLDVSTINSLEISDSVFLIPKKDINVILKKYAEFFELDFKKLKQYFSDNTKKRYYKSIPFKKINQNFSFFGLLKTLSIAVVFLFLFFYIGVEVKNRYSKPDLFVASPVDNYNTKNKEIFINGKTITNAIVKINGEFILIDSFGNFSKSILLNNGLNIIRISAAKDGGRESVVTKRVVLDKENKVTLR